MTYKMYQMVLSGSKSHGELFLSALIIQRESLCLVLMVLKISLALVNRSYQRETGPRLRIISSVLYSDLPQCIEVLKSGLLEIKLVARGSLGGAAVWRLPLAQGTILETRDRIPHRAPGAWSLLLPMSLPLSLSLCDYRNMVKI